jgi:hypothetical protein
MPAECEEDDLVILDAIHMYLLLIRLSMNMLIYAWGVVAKSMSNGELEKAKAKIKETLKRIEEVYIDCFKLDILLIIKRMRKYHLSLKFKRC